jgi:hypothetical protein
MDLIQNLKNVGMALLFPQLNLKAKNRGTKRNPKFIYEADEEEFQRNGFTIRQYKIDASLPDDSPLNFAFVKIYEGTVNGENVRIVTLPIDKQLINTGYLVKR